MLLLVLELLVWLFEELLDELLVFGTDVVVPLVWVEVELAD